MNIQSPKSQIPFKMEPGATLKDVRESVKSEYITATLKRNKWNVNQTAKELDVDQPNLHKKINLYGLRKSNGYKNNVHKKIIPTEKIWKI